MTTKPTGYILYEGPSLLDGAPIVVIATGFARRSSNAKTGDMVQTYIIRSDVDPVAAAREGADAAVCGDCKHRPANGGACYVTLIHGPASVYRAYKAGKYPKAYSPDGGHILPTLGAGRMVRLGTYGDPAAVPSHLWERLCSAAAGRTGYTHQWRNGDLPAAHLDALRALVMASVDDEAERAYAQQLGWRYFRIRGSEAELLGAREFTCPASLEAGKVKTCATCGACDGAHRGAGKASPVIVVHGARARRFVPIIPA